MKSALCALFLLLAAPAAFADNLPANTGFVTDAVGLLTPGQEADLESVLKEYEGRTGTEIAVLIVANTGGKPTPDYAVEVANKWGVGKKGVDNGALLVVAVETHKIFIAVGRQLEGAVTDSQAAAIARNVISPPFKRGNFYAGLRDGIAAIQQTIAGESFTEKRMAAKEKPLGFRTVEYLLFFGVMAFSWLAAVLGRTKAIWPGGAIGTVIGAGIAWFFGYTILAIVVIAVLAGAAGLGFDWFVSKNYEHFTRGGPTPPWWMGGGMGGGGGFGGGSGGFGGGGFSGGGGGSDW